MTLNSGVFLDLATIDNGDLRLDALDRTLSEWRIHLSSEPGQLGERLAGADMVVTNKVVLGRTEFDQAPELKLVAVAATGTDVIDLGAAAERGITVCNLRNYCTASVAQHVMTLILNLITGQPDYARRAVDGSWTESGRFSLHDRPIRELGDMTMGIIGYGNLGQAVAHLARKMGMTVLVGERQGARTRADRLGFAELVANVDVLSLHCPLTTNTVNMIDAEVLSSMRNDALLINTARGGIINEADLADALRAGRIGGAGIDVLSVEPPPADHPLLAEDIPNLLLTPHNAWASVAARQACIDQLTAVIGGFQRGQPLNRLV